MMSIRKVDIFRIPLILLFLLLLCPSFGYAENSTFGNKEQLNKLNEYLEGKTISSDQEKQAQINNYLKNLNNSDLLEILEQASEKELIGLISYGITGELKRRWGNNPPVTTFIKEITNKTKHRIYREVLIDYLSRSVKVAVREGNLDKKILEINKATTLKTFEAIAKDERDNNKIRGRALSEMGAILLLDVERNNLPLNKKEEYGNVFLSLLENEKEDSFVKGRAIKALRMIHDTRAIPALINIITDYSNQQPFVIRSASIALAKIKEINAVVPLSALLYETKDESVFNTAAYALGLIESKNSIKPLVDNFKRFDSRICEFTLRDIKDLLIDILNKNEETYLIEAIQGISLINQVDAIPLLLNLVNSPNYEIRYLSIQAIYKIGKITDLENVLNLTTKEDNPVILELLTQIKKKLGRKPVEKKISKEKVNE
ncbi:MAG TPA: HEAT repeat domain-containing protein [Candidatus Wujingus californicus]|uniref:HEAT repeat domain-containing protein n=1 Tax=Candidatus Wujingus californicus TaxID=3367618 RepID=UPI001DB02085|nr:HEAT repeat domain-containing protein [Planctomycetota bacterium]MDO8131508.1 HEAT repeat domain-containing protein [Candidatus Brocadiales bacterium]